MFKIANTLAILLFLLLLSCSNEAKLVEPPGYSEVELKQIIENGWDKTLFEIDSIFPNGRLKRGDLKERVAANYFVGIKLKEIGISGHLRIHQKEESLQKNIVSYPVNRVLLMEVKDKNEMKRAYNKISSYLEKTYPTLRFEKDINKLKLETFLLEPETLGGVFIKMFTQKFSDLPPHLVLEVQNTKAATKHTQ